MAKKKKLPSKKKKSVNIPKKVNVSDQDALAYHEYASTDPGAARLPGKIEVNATKACLTQRDLSLAYTPGVAAACEAIAQDESKAALYTARSNLVAVVSNGSAVLGLGNIGPLASKPVMEGKAVLFKRFADINVFDIEINAPTADEMVKACEMLEPTVGGINLEDIKAPECFEVERRCREKLKIPVFHDDQHGTAIIVAAALLNACKLGKKKLSQIKMVFNGAGAAAIACAKLVQEIGVKRSNIYMCDRTGVIHSGRTDLDPFKQEFALKTTKRSLTQALKGADVFVGLSVGNVVTKAMVKGMAKHPVIFALANPTPEIAYEDAKAARPDAIVATGRSDYPNQINNVLGFPYIFRGALDVQATTINEEMKMAAAKALAKLAQEQVPESVATAYDETGLQFGPDYFIPKPLDTRALYWVAPAVAEAAIKTKVARHKLNIKDYTESLRAQIDPTREVIATMTTKAKRKLRRIVFPQGTEPKVIRAAHILKQSGVCEPILLGSKVRIEKSLKEYGLSKSSIKSLDPRNFKDMPQYVEDFYRLRQRHGMSMAEAEKMMERRTYLGLMMLHSGAADAVVSGLNKSYPETIRPALQIIPMNEGYKYAAGLYIVNIRNKTLFFADTTVNISPSEEALAEIALQTAAKVEFFDIKPRIAMLSFSNFGSAPHPLSQKILKATERVKKLRPDLEIEGEMQADTAVTQDLLERYSFSNLKTPANVLIFPDLASGNIAYKLLQRLANAEVIGPILIGPRKPVHVLQQSSSVEEIVNIATIAAAEANSSESRSKRKV